MKRISTKKPSISFRSDRGTRSLFRERRIILRRFTRRAVGAVGPEGDRCGRWGDPANPDCTDGFVCISLTPVFPGQSVILCHLLTIGTSRCDNDCMIR